MIAVAVDELVFLNELQMLAAIVERNYLLFGCCKRDIAHDLSVQVDLNLGVESRSVYRHDRHLLLMLSALHVISDF